MGAFTSTILRSRDFRPVIQNSTVESICAMLENAPSPENLALKVQSAVHQTTFVWQFLQRNKTKTVPCALGFNHLCTHRCVINNRYQCGFLHKHGALPSRDAATEVQSAVLKFAGTECNCIESDLNKTCLTPDQSSPLLDF